MNTMPIFVRQASGPVIPAVGQTPWPVIPLGAIHAWF